MNKMFLFFLMREMDKEQVFDVCNGVRHTYRDHQSVNNWPLCLTYLSLIRYWPCILDMCHGPS